METKITQQELDALIQIIQRALLTNAEALWLTALLNRLSSPSVGETEEADQGSALPRSGG